MARHSGFPESACWQTNGLKCNKANYLIYELIQSVRLDLYATGHKNLSISGIVDIAVQIFGGLNYAHNKKCFT
jgi:Protein kinase domain.